MTSFLQQRMVVVDDEILNNKLKLIFIKKYSIFLYKLISSFPVIEL